MLCIVLIPLFLTGISLVIVFPALKLYRESKKTVAQYTSLSNLTEIVLSTTPLVLIIIFATLLLSIYNFKIKIFLPLLLWIFISIGIWEMPWIKHKTYKKYATIITLFVSNLIYTILIEAYLFCAFS